MTFNGRRTTVTRQRGIVNIPVSASRIGQVAVTFPQPFATAPTVTVSPKGNTAYNAGWDAATTTGVVIAVNHIDGTAATTTVSVGWIADAS